MGFVGELGLDGSIRSIPGVAPMAGVLAVTDLVVPVGNAREAAIIADGRVRPCDHLREFIAVCNESAPWPDHDVAAGDLLACADPDLADVIGQPMARQALEIAAAGGHHCLFVGPPGAGKTMLAARLPSLLPPLGRDDALAVTMVHSAAGVALPPDGLVTRPPFRSPHHTSSQVAMVGGGSTALRPGEISISHCGVLFMDELPEFAPRVMDTIRQPLEEGEVSVSRAALHVTIPSKFQLVAAMNPCPCGDGNEPGGCECGDARLRSYVGRVSGPLLDRFDLRVKVDRPNVADLLDNRRGESSAVVRERVAAARRRSLARQGVLNHELAARDLDRFAPLEPGALDRLRDEMERGRLSARGYHRVRRVARTIGDLRPEGVDVLDEEIVALAMGMRVRIRPAHSIGRAA